MSTIEANAYDPQPSWHNPMSAMWPAVVEDAEDVRGLEAARAAATESTPASSTPAAADAAPESSATPKRVAASSPRRSRRARPNTKGK